ncbi:hypothetical protein FOL46_009892 [Perkinsus olseni]|uniref:Uncharacterized protein n=1 Tax=Perkinsus olseni TaxID=32597 RepID=A0A7J6KZY9_PEROL|nr:hypothetical protein FOL46_009892 [Perkinsus olseni]
MRFACETSSFGLAARREGLREKIVKAEEAIIQLERLCQQDLEDILRDRRPHLAIIQLVNCRLAVAPSHVDRLDQQAREGHSGATTARQAPQQYRAPLGEVAMVGQLRQASPRWRPLALVLARHRSSGSFTVNLLRYPNGMHASVVPECYCPE